MHRIILFTLILTLTACATTSPTPTAKAPSPQLPATNSTLQVAPTPTKAEPTKMPTSEPITLDSLGITKSDMVKAFAGVNKSVTKEADGTYSVQATVVTENKTNDGFTQTTEKYTIDTSTFNDHQDLNNAYAPATVTAKDASGKTVTLIWNSESGSWTKEFDNLSTDIETPTDFPYELRIPMLQSILLQHADPFTQRSKGLLVRSEKTADGRVVYLSTNTASGTESKQTDYWLRIKMPDGSLYWINPTDINDINERKIMMCAYPTEYTNPTKGKNAGLDKGLRAMLISYLAKIKSINGPMWGILQADSSFLNKFTFRSTSMPGNDGSDMNNLLSIINPKNDPTTIANLLPNVLSGVTTHFSDLTDKDSVTETSVLVLGSGGNYVPGPVDEVIQTLIIPCSPQ